MNIKQSKKILSLKLFSFVKVVLMRLHSLSDMMIRSNKHRVLRFYQAVMIAVVVQFFQVGHFILLLFNVLLSSFL